jgi:glutamate 5-kinase
VNNGIAVNIINGRKAGTLHSLLQGHHRGTEFKTMKTRMSSKKGWIAYGTRAKGSLTIDDGAVRALVQGGKSLLPSGIVALSGRFESGDAVYCNDFSGKRIAKGLVNYASSEVEKIRGKRTSEIEEILGYRYTDEVIHRDNLVLL